MVYNANSMQSDSQIANFFNNQSVFITGASGFLGKVSQIFDRFSKMFFPLLKMDTSN